MRKIKTQTVYICPETGKKCLSRAEAERSADLAIKAKEEAAIIAEQKRLKEESNLQKKDWIRLNLANIEDIPKLVKEKAKEFWGIDCEIEIHVSFGNVSNSHCSPLNKIINWNGNNKNYPTSFLGWIGQIKGNVFNYKKSKNDSKFVSSLLFNNCTQETGFRAFYTGTGCPGNVEGDYPMDIGFRFFLEDFPLLQAKYDDYLHDQKLIREYNKDIANLTLSAIQRTKSDEQFVKLETQIQELENQKTKFFNNRYESLITKALENKSKPKISKDYENLTANFAGYVNDPETFATPERYFLDML